MRRTQILDSVHFILYFLILPPHAYINGLTCLSCTGISTPEVCGNTVECGMHEECYLEQYVTPDSHLFYNSGCQDIIRCSSTKRLQRNITQLSVRQSGMNTLTCDYCCNSNLCNFGGCGSQGIPERHHRGPICYFCNNRREGECNTVQICHQDDVCKISSAYTLTNSDNLYTMGCMRKDACDRVGSTMTGLVGKRNHLVNKRSTCINCCGEDLCNTKCVDVRSIHDCSDILRHNSSSTSGKYTIHKRDGTPVEVICDMTTQGGGWTAFQMRKNSSVNFFRGWEDYKHGFGQIDGNFYLGNDLLHQIADPRNHNEILVLMESFTGKRKYAKYSNFSISDENDGYRLFVSQYSGTAGDSLSQNSGNQFSTFDADHDLLSKNCASLANGAWWYGANQLSNLNGLYSGRNIINTRSDCWYTFYMDFNALKETAMLVRRIT